MPNSPDPPHAHSPIPRSHHRDLKGGAARAAVFGVSDGLLTNIALILGVAGANPGASIILLSGLAGLIAGASSMAAGEYVSMAAQSDLMKREVEIERRELQIHPEAETRELADTFRRRGVTEALSLQVATEIMRDPEAALEVHVIEEMGIHLGNTGKPWSAAGASFVTFILGAAIPLLPWFFFNGNLAILLSLGLGLAGVAGVGWSVAFFTGRSKLLSVARQVGFALVATAITYAIGTLVRLQTGL